MGDEKTDYESLLKRAEELLPINVFETNRFEIPRADSFIMGNRTIVKNFREIAQVLNRDVEPFLKYILRELATAGNMSGQEAIFQGKFSSSVISEKIEKYAKESVICTECNRPDTRIIREDRITFLQCEACGARYPIKHA
ncbi:MAG: Translation initiation factor 2 subunit beta [Candidatus Methanofastidiosum methylothiophilum]|mgnify:FL=1|uniref:Translation initiation factor 2 subunit beta n=1 Tax=Candidatus Methanofastidiosum methylothiophilum TaxID=1705564 RepID=A0A150IV07_9EURY|nr:MAG: Translation initiation factor 2 subunit beta [Candidatus Methanofastidiosum methylthiophilus]